MMYKMFVVAGFALSFSAQAMEPARVVPDAGSLPSRFFRAPNDSERDSIEALKSLFFEEKAKGVEVRIIDGESYIKGLELITERKWYFISYLSEEKSIDPIIGIIEGGCKFSDTSMGQEILQLYRKGAENNPVCRSIVVSLAALIESMKLAPAERLNLQDRIKSDFKKEKEGLSLFESKSRSSFFTPPLTPLLMSILYAEVIDPSPKVREVRNSMVTEINNTRLWKLQIRKKLEQKLPQVSEKHTTTGLFQSKKAVGVRLFSLTRDLLCPPTSCDYYLTTTKLLRDKIWSIKLNPEFQLLFDSALRRAKDESLAKYIEIVDIASERCVQEEIPYNGEDSCFSTIGVGVRERVLLVNKMSDFLLSANSGIAPITIEKTFNEDLAISLTKLKEFIGLKYNSAITLKDTADKIRWIGEWLPQRMFTYKRNDKFFELIAKLGGVDYKKFLSQLSDPSHKPGIFDL